jgi:ABC-type multidrug transport system fused ATPase/permease subunit
MTDTTTGAGTACPSSTHEFTLYFSRADDAHSLVFSVLGTIVCLFVFSLFLTIILFVLRFSFFLLLLTNITYGRITKKRQSIKNLQNTCLQQKEKKIPMRQQIVNNTNRLTIK